MTTLYCTDSELKSLFYGHESLLKNINHIGINHFDDYIVRLKKNKKFINLEDFKIQ